MKHIYTLFVLLLIGTANAQTGSSYNFEKVQITVVVPDEEKSGLPPEAMDMLETRLNSMVVGSGLGNSGVNPRFVLAPKITVLTEVVTSSAPAMILQELEITLFMGDAVRGTLVHRKSFIVKGVGTNKIKCAIDAFKKFNPEKEEYKLFVTECRQKIIQYYETSCSDMVAEADALIKQGKYEEAIRVCMAVPSEITGCYEKMESKAIEAYKLYSNLNCKQNLIKAKAAKATSNFADAVQYIGLIDPTSNCAKEAELMIKEMEKKFTEKEKRDWEFALKQYNDNVMLKKLRIQKSQQMALPSFGGMGQGLLGGLMKFFK